ncbi:MAG: hypothetical protein ACOZNI_08910 [Myxococcota bacterium]
MSTLAEAAAAAGFTWPEAEAWAERLLDAVAKRHAAGKGGPCGPDAARVDFDTLVLPEEGPAPAAAAVSAAAAKAAWEVLAARPWREANGDPNAVVFQRWPEMTPAHVKVLARGLAAKPPPPGELADAWREVRARSGAALRPLKLGEGRGGAALKTGLHQSKVYAPPAPSPPASSPSVAKPVALAGVAIGALLLLGVVGVLAGLAWWAA